LPILAAACRLSGGSVLVPVEGRNGLTGEDEAAGPVGAVEDLAPHDRGLVRIGRADDVEAGDRAQRGEVLDRLVRGTVLAEADRIMRPDEQGRHLLQSGQADRRTLVVAEDEERAAVGAGTAVERDAVADETGGELRSEGRRVGKEGGERRMG